MKTLQDCLNRLNEIKESVLVEEDTYTSFENSVKSIASQYNSGLLSKLEYISQIGKLISDFIASLAAYDETERGEMFDKANALVDTLI